MNYYEKHLGDYAKDTAHLSMLEHGAYNLLLDRYYATEQGIPDDQKYRVARARTKEDCRAVDAVLTEFFKLFDGVWHKNRCEEEIAKAQAKIEAARKNGKGGGRPRKNPEITQEEPNGLTGKPSGLLLGSENETQAKALQSPVSSLHEDRSRNSPRKKSKSPKTQIPEDFDLTPERKAYAEANLPGVDAVALLENFRSKAKAKAWKYADWHHAFQTLVRAWAPNSGHWSSGEYPRLPSPSNHLMPNGEALKWQ